MTCFELSSKRLPERCQFRAILQISRNALASSRFEIPREPDANAFRLKGVDV